MCIRDSPRSFSTVLAVRANPRHLCHVDSGLLACQGDPSSTATTLVRRTPRTPACLSATSSRPWAGRAPSYESRVAPTSCLLLVRQLALVLFFRVFFPITRQRQRWRHTVLLSKSEFRSCWRSGCSWASSSSLTRWATRTCTCTWLVLNVLAPHLTQSWRYSKGTTPSRPLCCAAVSYDSRVSCVRISRSPSR